ncbi:hypothetical protein KWU68_17330, partial [Clostridioides difficile]|nr:hypothetical protein [Clostridioides difficile]
MRGIKKGELGKILSNENVFNAYTISVNKERAIKTWNEYVKKEIKNLNERQVRLVSLKKIISVNKKKKGVLSHSTCQKYKAFIQDYYNIN